MKLKRYTHTEVEIIRDGVSLGRRVMKSERYDADEVDKHLLHLKNRDEERKKKLYKLLRIGTPVAMPSEMKALVAEVFGDSDNG